ncbi:TetR/AcrR family transcriptional regulator [Cryobacterium tagatosivorans]|nr:TetR/AcrR family transcriptional regulator [Cryobacterium tagatosivorans]
MSLNGVFGHESGALGQIRTEPMQQRSAARLSALLDAAAAVVDEVGFDRITTAMVAERAGASIGTVYRYYPDRVAVLHALRERAVLRCRQRVAEELGARQPKTWWDAVDCAVTAFVGLYRFEPGFRILHFADRDRAPISETDDVAGFFARQLANVLVDEFGLPAGPDLIFRLEMTVEIADALLSRAFQSNPQGDPRFIAESRRIMHDYLAGFYGPSAGAPPTLRARAEVQPTVR